VSRTTRKKRVWRRLMQRQILSMMKKGIVTVDEDTNTVVSRGRVLTVFVDRCGYLYVFLHKGDRRRGVFIHQLCYWKHTSKTIKRGWVLDHVNANNQDNRWSNLELMTREEHLAKHACSDDPFEDSEVPF